MKLLKLAFKRETAAPMLALSFATLVCVLLLGARILWTGDLVYGSLLWNLLEPIKFNCTFFILSLSDSLTKSKGITQVKSSPHLVTGVEDFIA